MSVLFPVSERPCNWERGSEQEFDHGFIKGSGLQSSRLVVNHVWYGNPGVVD